MSWTTNNIPSQAGRLVVVTGTGGLGYEDALALASKGASVVLAGRSEKKGAEAVARIKQAVANANILFEHLDLADLASIEMFAKRMEDAHRPIDILINNAGVAIVTKRQTTKDGLELQIGTNHFGHFALTMRLMPLLLKTPAPRVVSLSSTTHKMGSINFDDLQSEQKYSPQGAYAQSKLATLMFSQELDRRVRAAGLNLVSVAAHPGIAQTELMNNGPAGRPVMQFFAHLLERALGQSPAEGALPTLRAATDPAVEGGSYWGPSGFLEAKGAPGPASKSKKATDEDAWRRLWDASVKITGLDLPKAA